MNTASYRPQPPADHPAVASPPADFEPQAPESQPAAPPREDRQRQDGRKRFDDLHVYGGKGALSFSVSETRNGNRPTILIEGAQAVSPRKYDWAKKISFQLTMQELPVVAAVFLGIVPSAGYRNHGDANDKWFFVERQKDGFFVKIGQSKRVIAVPVSLPDAFYVGQLFLAQVMRNRKGFGPTDTLNLLRQVFRGYEPLAGRNK